MKMAVVGGQLVVLAETAREGFELAELVRDAWLQDRHLTVETNGNGSVGLVVHLPDFELAKLFNKEDK